MRVLLSKDDFFPRLSLSLSANDPDSLSCKTFFKRGRFTAPWHIGFLVDIIEGRVIESSGLLIPVREGL